jgi:Flp pilus assembly protein TadB
MVDTKEILKKYGSMIEKKIGASSKDLGESYSSSYVRFKQEMAPQLSRYEKWCKSLGSIIKLNVSKKDEAKVKKQLEIAHLDVEPWQALTLSVMAFLSVFLIGLMISIAIPLISGSFSDFPFVFFILVILLAMFLFYFFNSYPQRLANKWRLKASSQMVPAILYIVVYMRHTSNLEKAIAFASENLQYPLALDFRKVFYNLQIGKFSTIKESLDNYLETWRDYSPEFIESFHLIESSLFEPDNTRRIQTLEKSLQVILDGVYDKMLKFTHSVRSPLNSVYMLAVVLPVLGIALLPLASAMLGGLLKTSHIFILYNLLIPFIAFFMLNKILLLRPGGYGETELLERNPLYSKYKSKAPYFKAFLICLPILLIGLLPLIFQYTPIPGAFGLKNDYMFSEIGLSFFGDSYIFDFKAVEGGFAGPFGIGALFFGLFFPLSVALFFVLVYSKKTKELVVEREKTRQLEKEFNNSLFQLGNRLGNGMPPELVFAKVAESSRGLRSEDFFKRVNYNIQQMGMSVESSIFDPRRGALRFYPSDLIATSMRILVESVKKGLNIAAISLMSISQYVKNIQKITDRLKDLLAEVISEMKSNMTFLAPLLLGIVVGLSAMITSILNKLIIIKDLGAEGAASLGGVENFIGIFDVVKMIPPYYLQIAVGIYLIQVIFILTGALVSIDSGEDKLEKMNKTGRNLKRGILLYFIVALFATMILFAISSAVLGSLVP